MNTKRLLLAAALAGGLLSTVATQAAVVVTDIVTDSQAFSAPVPLKVVSPQNLPNRYRNETIQLSLTIDEQGNPHNVEILSNRDRKLAERLLPAVKQWQFKPAMKDGRAVSAEVVLPLEVVEA